MRETDVGAAYVSNDPRYPMQIFVVDKQEDSERFGKPNRILTVRRFAFNESTLEWYKVATEDMWLYTLDRCILGRAVISEHFSSDLLL